MNYWFIILGSNKDKQDKKLYQLLASKHSIVKIGYAIDENITDLRSIKNINTRLKEILEKRNIEATSNQIYRRAGLINDFINKIEIGDIIISPFDGGSMRIGEVISECNTLESFFEDKEKLKEILKNHPGSEIQGKQEVKPARKVKWFAELKRDEFPAPLREHLEKPMLAAVNYLKLSDSDGFAKANIDSFIKLKKAEEKINSEEIKIVDGEVIDGADEHESFPRADAMREWIYDFNLSAANWKAKIEKEKNEDWLFKAATTSSITAIITAISTALATAFIMVLPKFILIIFSIIFCALTCFILYIAFNKERREKIFHACNQFKKAYSNGQDEDEEEVEWEDIK